MREMEFVYFPHVCSERQATLAVDDGMRVSLYLSSLSFSLPKDTHTYERTCAIESIPPWFVAPVSFSLSSPNRELMKCTFNNYLNLLVSVALCVGRSAGQ